MKNYVETTDVVVVSDVDEYKLNGYANGYDYTDSDDDVDLPPVPSPKVRFSFTRRRSRTEQTNNDENRIR